MAAFGKHSTAELKKGFDALHWQNPPSFDMWLREVETTRKRGFSVDRGNYIAGVTVVAVPILDSKEHMAYALAQGLCRARRSAMDAARNRRRLGARHPYQRRPRQSGRLRPRQPDRHAAGPCGQHGRLGSLEPRPLRDGPTGCEIPERGRRQRCCVDLDDAHMLLQAWARRRPIHRKHTIYAASPISRARLKAAVLKSGK